MLLLRQLLLWQSAQRLRSRHLTHGHGRFVELKLIVHLLVIRRRRSTFVHRRPDLSPGRTACTRQWPTGRDGAANELLELVVDVPLLLFEGRLLWVAATVRV